MSAEYRDAKYFHPRQLTSFHKHHLVRIKDWAKANMVHTEGATLSEDVSRILDAAQVDERGRMLDEKGKNRLRLGLIALGRLLATGVNIDRIDGEIQVWQITPDEKEVRWHEKRPSY